MLALHDPYSNALRLSLAVGSQDSAVIERIRKELITTAQHGREGAYWEFDGLSPFYGWGIGGRLETTAMALAAFNAVGNQTDKKLEDDALLYLLVAAMAMAYGSAARQLCACSKRCYRWP